MTFQKDVLSLITGCLKLLSLSDLVMDSVNALGTGKVSYLYHGKKTVGWMTDVLYVPKLTSNLFSRDKEPKQN